MCFLRRGCYLFSFVFVFCFDLLLRFFVFSLLFLLLFLELPVFLEYSSIQSQLRADASLLSTIESKFHAYAKAWWSDYCALRPLNATRIVPIFALDSTKRLKCICTFVTPLQADRCLDSPLHAARFVRLIPYKRDVSIGGRRTEVVHSAEEIFFRRTADIEERAILLCSLLVGFGLDAYVAVGTVSQMIDESMESQTDNQQ